MNELKATVEELLALAPTTQAVRDLGDQLLGSAISIWLAAFDEQGIPREVAVQHIAQRALKLAKAFSDHKPRALDA